MNMPLKPPIAKLETGDCLSRDEFERRYNAMPEVKKAEFGQAKIDEEGYLCGAPDLGAEVARSSVSIDLGPKKIAYRRNGMRGIHCLAGGRQCARLVRAALKAVRAARARARRHLSQ